MSFKRMWALFVARNFEFIRDRAGFGWNILFPFLIVAGFGVIFSSDSRSEFKLGVFPVKQDSMTVNELKIPEKLKTYDHIKIVPFETHDEAMDKLLHHKIDILLENKGPKLRYWINNSSPKGYVLEKVVKESIIPEEMFASRVIKQQIKGAQVRYIDWLFPGILGMNIMFSSLFGVGYVIVRYRRSGVLKRLKATPVTAFEYLTAQLVSRVLILLATSSLVWFGCDLFFSFQMQGSYFDAFVIFLAGSICLVSLGLIIACRGTNEELTNGAINFICWPMMFLSE
ncbi:MAG: ABC transporter permease, partial [Desulfobacula sp.]|nr:ABC transporter permease [Desulfobacula sp.]